MRVQWRVLRDQKLSAARDGKRIRVTLGQGLETCDCEHATYRGLTCKHIAGLNALLAQMEERERVEWELAVAEAYLDAMPSPYADDKTAGMTGDDGILAEEPLEAEPRQVLLVSGDRRAFLHFDCLMQAMTP